MDIRLCGTSGRVPGRHPPTGDSGLVCDLLQVERHFAAVHAVEVELKVILAGLLELQAREVQQHVRPRDVLVHSHRLQGQVAVLR